ncbi:MAG: 23S rRNA (uracil(1939)-C(5))-methyltransferase RlmD [Actinomycetia bacterium]|nr:23S rRNA (uracil(1939)-C(5))-methyltransferase RlmD [Actinomycetes bacterium]
MVETLSLKRLSSDGAAIGRLADGRTAFVDYGCPGDVVEVLINEEKPRFVRGSVKAVIEPSPMRTRPRCPVFGRGACGGCQWQHLDPDTSRKAKRSEIVDALTRIGKIEQAEALTLETLATPQDYGYRNKIELEARLSKGRLELGFHRAGSAELISPDTCPLFSAPFKNLLKALQGALRYALGSVDFGLSRVALRHSSRTGSFEIACVTETGSFPRARLASTLKTACPQLTSIVRVLQKTPPPGGGRRRPSPTFKGVEVLAGAGYWEERLAGFTYKVSAPSFFQINTAAAELLVKAALAALRADGSDQVADLYCGVGTFSLPLATAAGSLIAVESSGSALRDLRRNLESAGLSAEIIGGEVGRDTTCLSTVDALLVDPPRAGLSLAARSEIARLAPARLSYVSCKPATAARDLAALCAAGYALRTLQPVDLFPQTPHIECVATLSKEPL